MKIALVSVGAPKQLNLTEAIADYEARIARYFKLEILEIRPQRIGRSANTASIIEAESAALSDRVPQGLERVALDRRGANWPSEELARYLDELAVSGRPGVAFLIGGPLGLSESLRKSSRHVLSLSDFTLPHEIARLVLAEQLYRAGTILRGEPYHKRG